MAEHRIITGVLIDEDVTFSFVEICQQRHVSKDLLLELLEQGLIQQVTMPVEDTQFDRRMLKRIESAHRLQRDLGVNTQGAILALELLDELDKLREEISILQRHIK